MGETGPPVMSGQGSKVEQRTLKIPPSTGFEGNPENTLSHHQVPLRNVSGFPGRSNSKEFPCEARLKFYPWIGKIPWRRERQPAPVFLPGESPWREQPGGLRSMGLQRVRHDCTTNTNTPTNTRNVSGTQDFISKSVVLGCRLLNMENPLSKPERLRKGKLGFFVILPGLYLS